MGLVGRLCVIVKIPLKRSFSRRSVIGQEITKVKMKLMGGGRGSDPCFV